MYYFHNNSLIEGIDILARVDDFGFQRGNTVFELLRVYGGNPYMLDDRSYK